MKVLALAGSPRRGGNTETLVDRVLAGAADAGAETEKIVASTLKMRGCLHCDGCLQTGVCVQRDDMTPLYDKLREMDAFVLASPLMFMNVSAQAKAVIDRLQCLWVARFILKQSIAGGRGRRGILVCVGGMNREDMFAGTRQTARAVFSTLEVKHGDELLYPNIDEKGAILAHPSALADAFAAGRRLVVNPAP